MGMKMKCQMPNAKCQMPLLIPQIPKVINELFSLFYLLKDHAIVLNLFNNGWMQCYAIIKCLISRYSNGHLLHDSYNCIIRTIRSLQEDFVIGIWHYGIWHLDRKYNSFQNQTF